MKNSDNNALPYKRLKVERDYLAPDDSEIRLLADGIKNGNMAHVLLPPGQTSTAVKHKTIEELWYVIEGNGEMWRKLNESERIDFLFPGASLAIPTGASFQFRNIGDKPLKIVIVSMPPWPGTEEVVEVPGNWK